MKTPTVPTLMTGEPTVSANIEANVTHQPRHQLATERGAEHRTHHHWHHQAAGARGRHAQHTLHEERQVDDHAKHPDANHEDTDGANSNHRVREHRQRNQGLDRTALHPQEREEHHGRERQQRVHARGSPPEARRERQRDKQRRNTPHQRRNPEPVKLAITRARLEIGKLKMHRGQRNQPHWQIHVEARAPGHMVRQPATERRPQH